MENIIKKLLILCMIGCTLLSVLGLVGCSGKAESISDENSTKISTTSFTLSIYDKYKLQEEESSANEKYFESTESISVVHIYDTTSGNANIEAFVDFYKGMLAEAYGLSDSQIKAEVCQIENHDKCYYLTYKYTQDAHDYVAAGYLIYEEGTILILTEAGYGSDEKTMKAELLEMAQTVNYTGDYHLPKEDEYPFTVENPYVRVAVNEGFDSPQAADVRNQEKGLYTTDSNKIVIRYTVADDYDKGMISLFSVEYLDSEASVDNQADMLYQSYQGGDIFEDSSIEELKLGEVWPNTFDVTAYRVCAHRQETNYSVERYFFQIGEKKFDIGIAYPFDDFETRDELYQIFYDVDFLCGIKN